MTTLKARKRRVRRRSAKKRVRRTKGKKNRRRRRTYKGGLSTPCIKDICRKWQKHMKHSYKMSKGIHPAYNNCELIPVGNYWKYINKTYPQIGPDNARAWGEAMQAAAYTECESNATKTGAGADPIATATMPNITVGAPVFNAEGELISGIAPTDIPPAYKSAAADAAATTKQGGGRRKSRRRRRRRRKKSKQSKKRRRRRR